MLLSKPAADTEDPAMDQPRKNAIWATFLMVAPPGSPEAVQAEARLSDVWSQLPGWAQEVSEPHAISCSRDGAEPTLYCRWPRAFVHGTAADLQPPGVLVLNDVEPADEATRHTHWRCWLHLYNTFQTLTGVLHSHSAPFFAVLEQFWQSILKRGEDELYTGYFIRSNPLFPCYLSLNHHFLHTVRPVSDPLG